MGVEQLTDRIRKAAKKFLFSDPSTKGKDGQLRKKLFLKLEIPREKNVVTMLEGGGEQGLICGFPKRQTKKKTHRRTNDERLTDRLKWLQISNNSVQH